MDAAGRILRLDLGLAGGSGARQGAAGCCNEETVTTGLKPAGEERGFGDDGGVAFGAGGDHADFDLHEFADEAEIVEGGFGKLGRIFYAVSVLAPAGERFIFGDDVLVLFREGRHFVEKRY